MPLNDP
jgi:hypothetical protein